MKYFYFPRVVDHWFHLSIGHPRIGFIVGVKRTKKTEANALIFPIFRKFTRPGPSPLHSLSQTTSLMAICTGTIFRKFYFTWTQMDEITPSLTYRNIWRKKTTDFNYPLEIAGKMVSLIHLHVLILWDTSISL